MKQIITAKLKLHTDKAQFQALRATQLAYRDGLNYVSRYAFEHGKLSSGRALQRECYDEIRQVYKLTYNYHRDYNLKEGQQVSILTLEGRVGVPYTGYSKHGSLNWRSQTLRRNPIDIWWVWM
jgi:putative transposase